jgi:PKD repeat protein
MSCSASRCRAHPLRQLKTLLRLVVATAVLSVGLQVIAAPAGAVTTTKVMALGDSITDGLGNSVDHAASLPTYRYYLWQDLVGANADFDFVGDETGVADLGNIPSGEVDPGFGVWDKDHAGYEGYRADQIISGFWPSEGNLASWLTNNTPDVVVLKIGTNDSLQGWSAASTWADIQAIVTQIQAHNPNIDVVLSTIIPITSVVHDPNAAAFAGQLNSLILAGAAGLSSGNSTVVPADVTSGFNAAWLYDGVHPNPTGQEHMASVYSAVLLANNLVTITGVNQSPVAAFSANCTGLTCSFNATSSVDPDGDITNYSWNFGDSTTGSGVSTSHAYGTGASFIVTLTVTDDNFATGNTNQQVNPIAPNQAPTASFTFNCSTTTCSFDGSGSSDPDGSIISYSWLFEAGKPGTGANPSYTFPTTGTYRVFLTVTDNEGATGFTSKDVVTANQSPVAIFAAPVCALLSCSVDGSASTDSDGTIAAYSWDWGDGSVTSGSSSSHAYAAGGSYTVTLTVTDNLGATDSASQPASPALNQAPVASFATPTCMNLTCTVDGSSSADNDGSITNYAWNWGDGVTTAGVSPAATSATASHTYTTPGTYTITLTVTDNDAAGATATANKSVTVDNLCSGGYYLGEQDGQVYPFGDGITNGPPAPPAGATLIDIQSTPTGCGFWLLYSNGNINPIGDAANLGNLPTTNLIPGEHFATFSATPTGAGLWGFTNLGRVITIGDATHLSDLPSLNITPAQDIVDSVALPSGTGYFMLGADGGIFAFGTATFIDSLPGLGVTLNSPAVGLVPDPDGTGYWIVASDGGAFGFSAPFRGSLPGLGVTPNNPIIGMVAFGNGYLQVATDGGVFNFSDQVFSGSLPQLGITPNTPIIAITPLP